MKRIICLAVVLGMILGMFGVGNVSAVMTYETLTEIGDIVVDGFFSIRYPYNGKDYFRIEYPSVMTDDDFDYLLKVFSDENLEFYKGEERKEVPAEEKPDDGNFMLMEADEEDTTWYIYFDEEEVYIRASGYDLSTGTYMDSITRRGWFKYRDNSVYNDLISFLNELAEKQVQADEEAWRDYFKNNEEISDIEILYYAGCPWVFAGGFGWGVCEYTKDGKRITSPFYVPGAYEPKTYVPYNGEEWEFVLGELGENNTIYFDMTKGIYTEDGGTTGGVFDFNNVSWLYDYEVQVDVTDDGEVESVAATYIRKGTNSRKTTVFDMNKYKESGTLPSSGSLAFLPENNVGYTGEEHKVRNFEKLYSAKFTSPHTTQYSYEWGLCRYTTDANGEKTRYYLYVDDLNSDDDIYYIAGAHRLSAGKSEYIRFENDVHINGYESVTHEYMSQELDFEVGKDGSIKNLEIFAPVNAQSTLMKPYPVTVYEESGSLKDMIDGIVADEEETPSDNEPEQTTETKQETEEKTDTVETNEDTSVSEEVKESEEDTAEAEDDVQTDYPGYADNLNRLGLFRGTENGYELERTLTRAEGATMLVRLLGQENSVEGALPMGAFSDVPADHWAVAYIEYCYRMGITKGTGDNCYSPEDTISGSEYMTLVLRALGYEYAEPETAAEISVESGLLSASSALDIARVQELDRDRMVNISYRALTTRTLSGETLIERLIAQGAVDKTTAKELGLVD